MSDFFLLPILLCAFSACCFSQVSVADTGGDAWWKHAVFYEIYPRSFADSNHDGIGDLNGITSKLDYLKNLGVDAIWITPFFPSPQVDFGYDVSDYENIDPMYGTLADFERLAKEAKVRGIRIILDFVVNHTSDQHPWFIDSRSSRNAAKRDWYIWRDGKATGSPPSNWNSTFGGSAWTLDPNTSQYYYHFFYSQQPDLNWRNPAVRDAMFDITRWWYQRGVAGFRLDAVNALFEDPMLQDNPVLPGLNKFGDPNEENRYNSDLAEVHGVLRGLRAVADEYDAVLIGETWTRDIGGLKQYYGDHSNELQMPMDLMFTTINKLSPPEFRRQIASVEAAGGWPVYVISNHDIVRSYVRYGDGVHNDAIAKLMAALYLTLRGSPIMYFGEEIGMENNDPVRKEDVKDPIGITGWPKEKGRDGERTPMQWTSGPQAGFSSNPDTWLPIAPNYKTVNVETESADPSSLLNWYKKLIALRRRNLALRDGSMTMINRDDPEVLAFVRRVGEKGPAVVVAINMSANAKTIALDVKDVGIGGTAVRTLAANDPSPESIRSLEAVTLQPFASWVGEIR